MTEYIYFYETPDSRIKIGWTSNHDKRNLTHITNGHKLLACLPGNEEDEKALLLYFDKYLVNGREWFSASAEILEYICSLLEQGCAAPNYESASWLPRMPFEVWKPDGTLINKRPIDAAGQMNLLDRLPVAERIQLASRTAILQSMSDNWFTPREWAIKAQKVMGAIDLDPASCAEANSKFIGASTFYSIEMNGLDRRLPWKGRIWLNPPYGRGENSAGKFTERLVQEIKAGNVTEAITCLNLNSMSNQWFVETCGRFASAQSIARGRINFVPPRTVKGAGDSPTKGTVFSYFGEKIDQFAAHFGAPGGDVYIRHQS